MKKIVSLLLCVALIVTCGVFFKISSSAEDTELKFNSDGKFKILVFADCQDDANPKNKMINFMNSILDFTKPDLVVFTGDNVYVTLKSSFDKGAKAIIEPLIQRGIPYAYTYGNHDDQLGVDKEYQYSVYKTLGNCLTYDADPSITGVGTCNLPIKSSNGNDVAFNLWMIDSNTYASGGAYDNVHQDQLDWIKKTNDALTASVGHSVNSMAFQHIIVPEAYDLLVESSSGSKTYNGKKYEKALNDKATGYLGEFPCPPAENSGELDFLANMGGVLGIVTGHDHSNSFVGTVKGVDLIQTAGMSFRSYGDDNVRGARLITLDEKDTSKYETKVYTVTANECGLYFDYKMPQLQYRYLPNYTNDFVGEIAVSVSSNADNARSKLLNDGYRVIYYDLNKGVGGKYIYMGYKTTNSYADAIKSIKFIICGSAAAGLDIDNYQFASTDDLNDGAGGKYIYCIYSKDARLGGAITWLGAGEDSFYENAMTATTYGVTEDIANLNEGAGSKKAYMYYQAVDTVVDLSALEQIVESYKNTDLSRYTKISAESFKQSLDCANNIIDDFKADSVANYTQAQIDTAYEDILSKYNNLQIDTHVHALSEWRVVKEPTTQNEGLERRTCECGKIEERIIEKLKSENLVPKIIDSDIYVNPEDSLMYGFTVLEDITNKVERTLLLDDNTYIKYENPDMPRTGAKVEIRENGTDILICSYTITVFGDVNGDGIYDAQDAAVVAMIAAEMLSPSPAFRLAADCNHDGKIEDADKYLLEQAGILLSSVDQQNIVTSSVYDEYVSLISQDIQPEQPSEKVNLFDDIIDLFVLFIKKMLSLILSLFTA